MLNFIRAIIRRRPEDLRKASMPFSLAGIVIQFLGFAHLRPDDMVSIVDPFLNPFLIGGVMGTSMLLFYFYYSDIVRQRYRFPRATLIMGIIIIGAVSFFQVEVRVAIAFATSALDYNLSSAPFDLVTLFKGELSWSEFDARYRDLLVLELGWFGVFSCLTYMVFSTVGNDPIELFYYKKLRKRFPQLPK